MIITAWLILSCVQRLVKNTEKHSCKRPVFKAKRRKLTSLFCITTESQISVAVLYFGFQVNIAFVLPILGSTGSYGLERLGTLALGLEVALSNAVSSKQKRRHVEMKLENLIKELVDAET
jgi:hypothetical protein